MNQNTVSSSPNKHAHPAVFMFLVLPFGIVSGYVTVTLAYLFSKAGVSVAAIAGLSAATILPGVLKFLWAPFVDTTFTLKKWYLLSGIATAAGMFALGVLPIKESSIIDLTIIIYGANIAASFLGIAVNGLIAHDIPEEKKGSASGWLNAGNLGGAGLGGGAGLWLAEHLNNNWMPSAILAGSGLLCCFGLLFVNEHPSTIKETKAFKTLQNLFKDIWQTLKARMGVLAMILCFLPLGTGAASNLWAAVAGNWNASANTVTFVTGIMSGLITAAGCLLGGWICDRTKRQIAYVVFGLMQAICLVAMAYTPHTEIMYILWTSLYAFTLGLCYAAFSAFVYEAIGKGAAGTKYTVLASLSNFPIYYMTIVDGWAQTKYGSSGMLDVEAVCAVAGIILFLGLLKYVSMGKKPESLPV
ncbi:MAG TPA: MFS transporter [Bacteroidia bacterium]|jgi:PAT family beta-lactamase induction signal transducer AmpG|nr:MFS transporter [Bacteroidia bacterium]